jgi:hypothetical protein
MSDDARAPSDGAMYAELSRRDDPAGYDAAIAELARRVGACDLAPVEAPTPAAPALAPGGVNILDLGWNCCRWIASEPPSGECLNPLLPIFCGRTKAGGASYCAEHLRLAYRCAR